MHKYWAWLGLNLGKHAGIVSIVGLMITIGLGFGITKLEFATGQDSYLNKDEEVYKNSVAYQELFGGQAMITLVTLGDGQELTDLFTPENVEEWRAVEADLKEQGGDDIFGVVTPLTALEFTNALVLPESGNVVEGVAAQILLGADRARPHPGGSGDPQRVLGRDARPGERHPRGGPGDRQRGVERLPPLRQRGRDPQGAVAVLPQRDERPDGRPPARQPGHRDRGRGRPARAGRRPPTSSSATPP